MQSQTLSSDDLALPFRRPQATAERIGMEIECGVVRPDTGRSLPYHGPDGVQSILTELLGPASGLPDGSPIADEDGLFGIQWQDGTKLSLEAGGAIEYSSPPAGSVMELVKYAEGVLAPVALAASRKDAAVLCDALIPFESLSEAHWIPEHRVGLMRTYCETLGEAGVCGMMVSTLATSTQITFDYVSECDLTSKVRMLMAASPIAAALFVNSPLLAGELTGRSSERLRLLLGEDATRFGLPPFAFDAGISSDHFIQWASGLPMLYRKSGQRYIPAPAQSFAELMEKGFGDGTKPTMADWRSQLSQVWPFVRVRETIEVRLPDGPPFWSVGSVPAFWAGLVYDAESREAAWDLVGGSDVAEQRELMAQVAQHGLKAGYRGTPVRELAAELLRLARKGLGRRIDNDLESPETLTLLEPLESIVASGRTFADEKAERWDGEFRRDPRHYVDAYRIPADGSPLSLLPATSHATQLADA